MGLKRGILIVFLAALILSIGFIFISADNEMIVEANFVGYGTQFISIIVPDYIYLGEVSKGDPSVESSKFYINNTGTIDVKITANISGNVSEVFNYLHLRKFGNSTQIKINDFETEIFSDDDKSFYVGINMTNFNGTLSSNDINLNATIKFTAMASS